MVRSLSITIILVIQFSCPIIDIKIKDKYGGVGGIMGDLTYSPIVEQRRLMTYRGGY